MELRQQLSHILESSPFELRNDFLKEKNVVVYGAGRLGAMVAEICIQNGIHISFFVDKNCDNIKSLSGIPVYQVERLKDIETQNTIVLVGAFKFPFYQMKSIIKQYTSSDIFTVYDLLYITESAYFSNGWFSGFLSSEDKIKIFHVFDSLDDITSQKTYLDFINWRVSRDEFQNIEANIISEDIKYHNEITHNCLSNDGSIVDVGSFDLSFSIKSLELFLNISKSYAFEPDNSSYAYCLKKLHETPAYYENIKLEHLAISEYKGLVSFAHGHGLASRLVHQKSETLQKVEVTTLTEYFIDNKIDNNVIAIKIHNEGDELQALKGAKAMIEKERPLLMVNCSHNRDGLYDIQQECMNFKNYKYYMRSHAFYGEGLTFYAVPS